MSKERKFNVVEKSEFAAKGKVVAGPHKWEIAHRKAHKLNEEAREAFRTGRITYDVPLFVAEEVVAPGAKLYRSRYVHKISPRDNDFGPNVTLDDRARSNRKDLASVLRDARILSGGERVNEYRVEPSGRIIVFPSGGIQIWHSIILTPA